MNTMFKTFSAYVYSGSIFRPDGIPVCCKYHFIDGNECKGAFFFLKLYIKMWTLNTVIEHLYNLKTKYDGKEKKEWIEFCSIQ